MLFLLEVSTIVLLSCSFFSPTEGTCPGGWVKHNESCYNFVQNERTWNTAQVDCIRYGSRLVKVDSLEENDFIRNYLANNGRYFYGYDMWMGGRRDTLGNWEWADGSPFLPDDFSDWPNGHPDNSNPLQSKCLQFESDLSYHWEVEFCDDLSFSICERPFTPLTPPPLTSSNKTDVVG